MNIKKIFSIVIVFLGALSIGFSSYIHDQVAQGKVELSDAKEKLDKGKILFSLTPITKMIGNRLTESVDQKVTDADEQILYYTNVANALFVGGIFLSVLGLSLSIFYVFRK